MNAFVKMSDWWDSIPAKECYEINELRGGVGHPPRGVPYYHGETEADQLQSALHVFRSSPEPRCLIRVGDTDNALLSGGAVLQDGRPLAYYFWHSGIDRQWFRLRPEFIEMVRQSPIVGIHSHQSWLYPAKMTETILTMLGIPLPSTRNVVVGISYYLFTSGALFSYLEGKRILLVGGVSQRVADAWGNPDFIEGYKHLGKLDKIKIVGAIPSSARSVNKDPEEVGQIMEQVKKLDFDVALVSAGGTGKFVTWRIWRDLQKTAIDIGAVFDAIVGVPTFRERGILNTVKWPEVKW